MKESKRVLNLQVTAGHCKLQAQRELDLFCTYMTMGHNLWLRFGVDGQAHGSPGVQGLTHTHMSHS